MLSFFIFFDQSLSSTEEIGINEIPELARNRVSASKIFIEVEGENLKVIDKVKNKKFSESLFIKWLDNNTISYIKYK